MQPTHEIETYLIALENRRCEAVSAQDVDVLDQLLAADLTHTHVQGKTQDKTEYLLALQTKPRKTWRESVCIRLYGSVAVMTGTLRNSFAESRDEASRSGTIHALQVWSKSEQGWQMVAFAASGPS